VSLTVEMELDDLERKAASGPGCLHEHCGGSDIAKPVTCSECGWVWPVGTCSYEIIWCWVCQVYTCYEVGTCCAKHANHQPDGPPDGS